MTFALIAFAVMSFGHSADAQISNQDQRLIDRQQNQIQQLQQQQFEKRERDRWQSEQPPGASSSETGGSRKNDRGTVCFVLRAVVYEGATLLSEVDKEALSAPYVGQCVTINDINDLIRAITDLYGGRGYVTTRAGLPKQNLSSGILTIQIMEGRIQGFLWNGEPADQRSQVIMAFPGSPDDHAPLNLRDLEQGLDQLNRLRANDAHMQLVPGAHPGDTLIAIDNQQKKLWRLTASLDDSGQSSTGQMQTTTSLDLEDMLGLDEDFSIDHGQDLLFDPVNRRNRNWSFSSSVPYGNWRASLSSNYMEYRSVVHGTNQSYQSAGTQRGDTLSLERLLHRDGDSKTYATLTLNYRSVQNDIEDARLESSSPKLTTLGFSVSDVRRLAEGVLHTSAQYSGGLHAFGARADESWPNSPKAEFTKSQLDVSYGHALPLGMAWSLAGHGQWTTDSLYSPEQISIGSSASVRGYRDQVLQGNRGGYLRNEISRDISTGIPAFEEIAGPIRLFAGYDIGVITHYRPETASAGRLSGAAAGFRIAGEWLEGEFSYAWALNHPASLSTPPHQITFSLALVL